LAEKIELDIPISEAEEPNLDLWLSSGLDIANRTLHLIGDVNELMLTATHRSIIALNKINNDPIIIHLFTAGGSMPEGFAIYDILRASPSPIIMIANGIIASMGIVIFLAGTERFALENTRFMIHSMSDERPEGSSKLKDSIIDLNEMKVANDMMFEIIFDRTKISPKSLDKNTFNHDYYFDVKLAEKYGIITKPKKGTYKK
jgi:ATP-dependent protease ClpP protease subunit